jgi:hypothetical protein
VRRVLADLEEVLENVASLDPGELAQRVVVIEAAVEIAVQLVAADVIERLFRGPVLVHLPRKEMIEGEPLQVRPRQQVLAVAARLGEDLRTLRHPRRVLALVGVVERPVDVGLVQHVRVGLLIALQVVPAREDHAAEAVDGRGEHAGRRVIEQAQRARDLVETPQPRDRRRLLVLVELRIEMARAVARAVGREEDAVVGAVDRRDVVVARGLAGDPADDRRLVLAEARDLVELPVVLAMAVLLERRADDHREERLRPAPVHGRVAHGDGVRGLPSIVPEARGAGEVLQRPVRIADPEIAAPRRGVDRPPLITERRRHRRKVLPERDLRHEKNRIRRHGKEHGQEFHQ